MRAADAFHLRRTWPCLSALPPIYPPSPPPTVAAAAAAAAAQLLLPPPSSSGWRSASFGLAAAGAGVACSALPRMLAVTACAAFAGALARAIDAASALADRSAGEALLISPAPLRAS